MCLLRFRVAVIFNKDHLLNPDHQGFLDLDVIKCTMECRYCNSHCVKAGRNRIGMQRYYCRACKRCQQAVYVYKAYHRDTNRRVVSLLVEGMGIRSISRVLKISAATVISRIRFIGKTTKCRATFSKNDVYEIDELWTSYVQRIMKCGLPMQ